MSQRNAVTETNRHGITKLAPGQRHPKSNRDNKAGKKAEAEAPKVSSWWKALVVKAIQEYEKAQKGPMAQILLTRTDANGKTESYTRHASKGKDGLYRTKDRLVIDPVARVVLREDPGKPKAEAPKVARKPVATGDDSLRHLNGRQRKLAMAD